MRILLKFLQYSGIGYLLQGILYVVLRIRHYLYDSQLLNSYKSPIHSIGLGNIEAGGSGKTPHTIFFHSELLKRNRVTAIISRGYGRNSTANLEVNEVNPEQFGDEPSVIYQSTAGNSQIIVAKNRAEAFPLVKSGQHHILFDDILQHRKVEPNILIALSRYNKPFTKNSLFPIGMCRDIRHSLNRCQYLVITYCPKQFNQPIQYIHENKLTHYFSEKAILFSTMQLQFPVALENSSQKLDVNQFNGVHLVSGIAHPEQFLTDCKELGLDSISYSWHPDHYQYKLEDILQYISESKEQHKAILLTAKDAVKWEQFLRTISKQEWGNRIYVCNQIVQPLFPEQWNGLFDSLIK